MSTFAVLIVFKFSLGCWDVCKRGSAVLCQVPSWYRHFCICISHYVPLFKRALRNDGHVDNINFWVLYIRSLKRLVDITANWQNMGVKVSSPLATTVGIFVGPDLEIVVRRWLWTGDHHRVYTVLTSSWFLSICSHFHFRDFTRQSTWTCLIHCRIKAR